MTKLGRLSEAELGQKVVHDAPAKQMAAVMSKLDEISQVLRDLTAKLDSDSGVDAEDYGALVASLKDIELKL